MSQYRTDAHRYKMLEDVRTRVGMYLNTRSISELWVFLNGFYATCHTFDIKDEARDELIPLHFGFFTSYVARRFGCDSSPGWSRIILNQTAQDEEKGFMLFYTLLEEFKQLRISKCFTADLNEANIAHHNTSEIALKCLTGQNRDVGEPQYKNPVKVFYAELTDGAELKYYIGVVETDTESFISGLPILFREEKGILADFKKCFGTIVWKKHNQKNIPLKLAY